MTPFHLRLITWSQVAASFPAAIGEPANTIRRPWLTVGKPFRMSLGREVRAYLQVSQRTMRSNTGF